MLADTLGMDESSMEMSPELEAEWFNNIGVSYCMAIFINVMVTHCTTVIGYFKIKFKRRFCWHRCALRPRRHLSSDMLT